ncbi:MAG: alpha/beta hydrolase fold domain-containing protein [Bacteroidaceae bacterium]|nr:alpha/beta hydrolase fold domain-containing protein [Bacteroidaceae bacterium]MBR5891686.1 alpha/beta hydrolase fold domain-containing protein [Bacteroidaceae bacterium]
MKLMKFLFVALFMLMAGTMQATETVSCNPATCNTPEELDGDSVWVTGEALITKASQLSANNTQSGFPTDNLLRPESEGYGTNQYIWHTSWGNPAVPPRGTDTYLQVKFNTPQTDIIFTMIGSTWVSTSDTPTEVVVMATNDLNGEWTEVEHLKDMQYDFTSFSPERYTSPRIALGAEYSYVRFVVKKTINVNNSSRYDTNGNPFVSLGRFQVYNAVKSAPTPVDKEDCINLLFIGNSITYGAGLSFPATEAPPAVCRELVESATGITTNLYNGGHSGITTLGFMPGRDDLTRLITAAKAFQKNNNGPIYISIMLGTNDSAMSGPEGAPVSPDNYKANMKAIIDELISKIPGCKILLNYPIWYSPNTYNGGKYLQEGLDRLRSYYPYIDEITQEYEQVIAGDRQSWEYFEDNNALFIAESGYSGTFYLHPNAQGARRLAEVWTSKIMEMIVADGVATTVTYSIEDADGNFIEEIDYISRDGDTISVMPDFAGKRAFTEYTIKTPTVVKKGEKNLINVVATWQLPFKVSTDLKNAYWYNLALREGSDYVTADNSYKCNTNPTREQAITYPYQWAFKGDPYNGIIVYNRSDTTKTLAPVNNKAVLDKQTYSWEIQEATNGFLLANDEGKYINEYGGPGGQLAFWSSSTDVGSIFNVSEVGSMLVKSVTLPSGASIKIFIASEEKANGRAVLVIPGGGYSFVAGSNEGADWAPFFNSLGYTVAVLKYTVPPTSAGLPLQQAREAMSHLRENAEALRVTTGQIGVMGFSAGGHLASTVATRVKGDEAAAFQILFYPVITMNSAYTHAGSRQNLLGSNNAPSLVNQYSSEKQVKAGNPMAYLCWADDDGTVSPRNSTEYIAALEKNGVPVHSINFPDGGHGYGYSPSFKYHDEIMEDLTEWMLSIDEVLTNIESPVYTDSEEGTYYNLQGQPVETPQRGIYIKKSKKIFIK